LPQSDRFVPRAEQERGEGGYRQELEHPLPVADAAGEAGDIQWNFEKFLVSPDGKITGRFRPLTDPEAPELVAAIESALA